MRAGFVFDDRIYVTENSQVQAGLSPGSIRWAFAMDERAAYYHPLTWLSLMLDWELFGSRPAFFHAVNVALHCVVAVLLFLALALGTNRPWPSLAATMLFAVHPLTVEGVAWVSERKMVLSGAFGMGAVLAYVAHARAPSWRRLAVVVALQTASLLAKPGLVVLPVLLLALDLWPLRRLVHPGKPGSGQALRLALVEKVPLVIASVAMLGVAIVSVRHLVQEGTPPSLSLRLANALAVLPRYLSAAFWPSRLAVFHPFPGAVPAAEVLGGAACAAIVTALGIALVRSRPWLLVGWVWFLAALLPYLGLMQAGLWPAWADRFAYVPLMGLALGVAFEAAEFARRSGALRTVAAAATLVAASALALAARVQVRYWQDSLTLYSRGVEVEPTSAVLHGNLGSELLRASRVGEAMPHLRLAATLAPDSGSARYNLGLALVEASRFDEALYALEEAVRLDPRHARAHSQLGTVLRRFGLASRAEAHYRIALRLEPDQPEATWNLADLLVSSGRIREALPLYGRFLDIAPDDRFGPQRRKAEYMLGR